MYKIFWEILFYPNVQMYRALLCLLVFLNNQQIWALTWVIRLFLGETLSSFTPTPPKCIRRHQWIYCSGWEVNQCNRPVALRGHATNASFKRWVGILLMPKIDRAHKNYLTAEIWEETHLREIFYGTLIFQQSSMICIGRHVGGHTLALQHGGQNYFLLISC